MDYIRSRRVDGALLLCATLEDESQNDLKYMVIGDERWFFRINNCDSMWLEKDAKPPTKSKQKIGAEKVMISVFWNPTREWLVDQLHLKTILNVQYYTNNIQQILDQQIDLEQELMQGSITLRVDNAYAHKNKQIRAWISGSFFSESLYPPYSPDLAPSDYFIFVYINQKTIQAMAVQQLDPQGYAINACKVSNNAQQLSNIKIAQRLYDTNRAGYRFTNIISQIPVDGTDQIVA
ncbi:MAG: hypothetical protein EZS28_011180, partial [Streblomastix strix]